MWKNQILTPAKAVCIVLQQKGEYSDEIQDFIKSANSAFNMKGKHAHSPKTAVLEIEESFKFGTSQATYICIEDSLSRRKRNSISRKRRKPERERERERSVCSQHNITRVEKTEVLWLLKIVRVVRFSVTRKANTYKKRVMKATIFSWLIDAGVVQENSEIFLIDERSKQMKNKGRIKREGIQCLCCNENFTVENFHLHGGRNCHEPHGSVFVAETKVSLLSYMFEAWNKAEEYECHKFNAIEIKGDASDIYDDACMICADGGDLMCCEECNSTYHQVCMDMKDVPEDSWYCPYCVCKFCGKPVHQNDYLLTCPQCEKRYHWECHQNKEERKMDLNIIPIAPFCERGCKEVRDKLTRDMVGIRNEVDEGYSWSLLHQMDDGCGIYIEDNYLRTMCHSKLAVARRLMEECFEPIEDRHTRIKVIPSVVYNCGSNFRRINFGGFYTAVLEKDEEIISVASLRIHGRKLAEMPFIATSEAYRRKGMCRKLMVAIESALCFLNVENLIIPSVPERSGNWMKRYGFCHLDVSMKKEIMVHNTLMFHDSVRLQKVLLSSSH